VAVTARIITRIAACLLAVLATAASAAMIDPVSSSIGFSLKTRWGQTLHGRFPNYTGEVAVLPDGRHQVRLRLSARDVEIVGNRTYTRMTRGAGFFDAARYPMVEFVSEAYPIELIRAGGRLGGLLTIRGVQRHEEFVLQPAVCERPAQECDVVATGSVDRNNYGVDRWSFALSSHVIFNLRVRTLPGE
jgi:polyisoprenoid-binding protein YceI